MRKPKITPAKWTDLPLKLRRRLVKQSRDLRDMRRFVIAAPDFLDGRRRGRAAVYEIYLPESDTYGWWSKDHPTWRTIGFKRRQPAEAVCRWLRETREHNRNMRVVECRVNKKGEPIRRSLRFNKRRVIRRQAPKGGAR